MKAIVYPTESGAVSVLHPTEILTAEEVARKDVPAGVPYLIVDTADIPTDRTFRDAWEADFSKPDGYGIGADAWLAEQAVKKVSNDNG